MKNSIQRTLVATFAGAVAVAILTGCGSSSNDNAGGTNTTAPKSSVTQSSTPPPSKSSTDMSGMAMITISNYMFMEPTTVKPGATVMVMNKDAEAHTVTSDDGSSFDVTIAPGQTATFTAPMKAGKYAYHCTYHSNMHATLTVK